MSEIRPTWIGPPCDLSAKRACVAELRGMVGAAIVRGLASEPCEVITADRSAENLTRQEVVERWMAEVRPQAIFAAAAKPAERSFPASGDRLRTLGWGRRIGFAKPLRMPIELSSRRLNDTTLSTPKEAEVQSAFELASFFRHKTLIALVTACCLFLGVIYAVGRPATYTASSQLLVISKQLQNVPDTLITSAPADPSLVQNQIEIIQSPSILLKAVHALNLKDDVELSSEVPGLSKRIQTWLTQSIDLPPVM